MTDATRVVHIFDKETGYGGCTVAYRPVLHDTQGNPSGRFAYVAVANCNPRDRYCRKTGRRIAVENLDNGESILLPLYEMKHPVLFIKNMFLTDYTRFKTPTLIR
jgi:hypothetical protein